HLEHLPHPRLDRVAWDAVELGVEAEVELRREVGVERRVLEHEADVAADLRPLAHDVVAGDPRLATRRGDEGAEDLDGGRLAGPVRAEEAEGLAGLDGEVDAVDRGQRPVGLAEAPDLHRRRTRSGTVLGHRTPSPPLVHAY